MKKVHSPKIWRTNKDSFRPRGGRLKNPKKNPSKKGGRLKKFFKWTLILGSISFVFGLVVFIGVILYFSKDIPDPNRLIDRSVAQSTKIYDKTGENLLYEIHGEENRTIIQLNEIPESAIHAVIALEDKDFYTKKFGLSFRRNLLAVFHYVRSKVTGSSFKPGASGITQQLVKNAILSREKTLQRKIKEWILTIQIERKFSKDEILQMYFNEIPYGSTSYGIESASQFYFGKSAKDLELAESALLAAIIQRPTYYSPYGSRLDELLLRKNVVLNLMTEQGYITQEQRDSAKEYELEFKNKIEQIQAPHFVFFVREFLTDYYGEKMVEEGGLKVITTLDFELQKIAEEAVAENMENIENFGGSNSSVLALDPKTGDILAMVGSKDYFDVENDGNVNVTIRPRQPGSSFKPIVYANALAQGYTPNTLIYDTETIFKTHEDDYIPRNYDLKQHGPVTITKALAGSLNIPAVKAIYLTGVESVLDFAERLGYTTFADRSRFGLSLVLGGGEVTLLDHLGAYSAFAQDGVRANSRSVLRIEGPDGQVLDEFTEKKKRVMDKQLARQMNKMMSDNDARAYVFGTRSALHIPGVEVAAKTGTTNDYRDAWTIGFTPDIVAGAWVGNNDNSKMNRGAAGGVVAAPVWNAFMSKALETFSEKENFKEPEIEEVTKPVLRGERQGTRLIEIDSVTGKLATALTPEEFRVKKAYENHHSILHYVYKDDPRAGIPEDPGAADNAYTLWEEGIRNWLAGKNSSQEEENPEGEKVEEEALTATACWNASFFEAQELGIEEGTEICERLETISVLPTEYDDVHTPENKPFLDILSPSEQETISSNEYLFRIDAFAARGVSRAEYYLGEELIGTTNTAPFSLLYSLSTLNNGFYTLKVIIYDDVGNKDERAVNFNLLRQRDALSVSWMGPKNNETIPLGNFPSDINLFSSRFAEISSVAVYARKVGSQENLVGKIFNPQSSLISISWNNASRGNYFLRGELQMKDGSFVNLSPIGITVE